MDEAQDKALVSLAKAFAKCEKASLVFQGMDDTLLAFDRNTYFKLTENESICEQQYKINKNQGDKVDTHGCYKDSGGW